MLISRGIAADAAARLAGSFEPDRIARQIEALDWLLQRQDTRVSRNPPGFLIRAIQCDYSAPPGFVSRDERLRREAKAASARQRTQAKRQRQTRARQDRELKRQRQVEAFWQSLSVEEALAARTEALAAATPMQRHWIQQGGSVGQATQEAVLAAYALARITQQS